jgi:preprotein translocase subunit SecG
MYAVITILIILVCVLLGAAVLIQNPKGGGLNSTFGGVGQQLLGARRSTDVIEKATWVFAASLIVLCLLTSVFVDKKASSKKEEVQKSEIEKNVANQPFSGGNFPAPAAPQQPQQGPAQQPAAPKK